MNKYKGLIICSLLAILSTILLGFSFANMEETEEPISTYQVYLDGEKIGLIDSKEDLYSLINISLMIL